MVITPASESVTNPGWFWPLAITWSWLGVETSWGCAAAVPAPRRATIAVMSRASRAIKMMRLIVSHLISYVTVAASSDIGAGASLNCSIYYDFLCELLRFGELQLEGESTP